MRACTVRVPSWARTILVRVKHGYDDTGDRKVSVFLMGPKNQRLLGTKSGNRGWDMYPVRSVGAGNYRLMCQDNDTKSGGSSPGNGITIQIQLLERAIAIPTGRSRTR